MISYFEATGDPRFSIDTKAKEHLGLLYRKGRFAVVVHLKRTIMISQLGPIALVDVINRMYATGRNATNQMKENLTLAYDELLPKRNNVANPET